MLVVPELPLQISPASFLTFLHHPTFSYIRKVTVTGPNSIKVDGYVDAAAAVIGYELLRSGSPAGPFCCFASC